MIDNTCYPGVPSHQKLCYQHVTDFTYWHLLGSFNSFNIVQCSHKETYSEYIEKKQVVLGGISYNMATLVQTGKYGAINTTNTTTMGYYVIKLFS